MKISEIFEKNMNKKEETAKIHENSKIYWIY
jgi:hypothetical protein